MGGIEAGVMAVEARPAAGCGGSQPSVTFEQAETAPVAGGSGGYFVISTSL